MSRGVTLVVCAPPPPVFGWATVAVVVILYDAWALYTGRPTLSSGFWGTRGWWGRFVRAICIGVTMHLLLGNKSIISRYITIPRGSNGKRSLAPSMRN